MHVIEFRLISHIVFLERGNRNLDTFHSNQMINSAAAHMQGLSSERASINCKSQSGQTSERTTGKDGFNYKHTNVEAQLASCQALLL